MTGQQQGIKTQIMMREDNIPREYWPSSFHIKMSSLYQLMRRTSGQIEMENSISGNLLAMIGPLNMRLYTTLRSISAIIKRTLNSKV